MAQRRRFGLFDAMGVGKTATAIHACDLALQHDGKPAKSILVICPASIRENWRREFIRFQQTPRKLMKVNTTEDAVAWFQGYVDVAIVSFERAKSLSPLFVREMKMFDVCIIDEGHYLKNEESARAKAILGPGCNGIGGILQWAEKAWWLTGTPAPNDPADLWTWLSFLDGPMQLNRGLFLRRYFASQAATYGSKQTVRQDRAEELRGIIQANSVLRTQKDVGIFLPPILMTTLTVDGDTRNVQKMLSEHPGLDQKILAAIDGENGLSGLDEEHIAALRRLIGEAKAVPYASVLADELESGLDKCVVFGHHRAALQSVGEVLTKRRHRWVSIQGGTSDADREEAVDAFNNDPDVRVFIGNHRAAGVGLNLQKACCTVDVFESDWTPAANAQSVKRVARYGQTREMRARFVSLNHWLEEKITETNRSKTERILELGLPEMLEGV